jgi:hypothetical protein
MDWIAILDWMILKLNNVNFPFQRQKQYVRLWIRCEASFRNKITRLALKHYFRNYEIQSFQVLSHT